MGSSPNDDPRAAKVTRFEVIDWRENSPTVGRLLTEHGITVRLSYQDDDRTLKVFLVDPPKK